MTGWRSTQTAPRDGTRILGWFGDRCVAVFWRSGPGYARGRPTGAKIWYWSDGYGRHREPDCWQPQPDPPDSARFPNKDVAQVTATEILASPAARRRSAPKHESSREIVRSKMPRWCGQCERLVPACQAEVCTSQFCKTKAVAA